MKNLNISLLIWLMCMAIIVPASAQKKPHTNKKPAATNNTVQTGNPETAPNLTKAEKAMKLYSEAKVLRSKYFNTNDVKGKNQVITKYKEAGKAFLSLDTFKNSPEKLYVQTYGILAYTSAMYFLRTTGMEKEVLTLADEITPKIWMANEKLPKEAKSLLPKDTSSPITPEEFINYRSELFEEIVAASYEKDNWKYQLKYGPKYLSILPMPAGKSDVKLVNERIKVLSMDALSSIKIKNADSCRKHVPGPFDFVVSNRSLIVDKEGTLKWLHKVDTMLNNPKFNYTDFDNDAKIRAQAARAFDRLEDHEFAYRLYDETIRAGNKSLSLYMARAESAALMEDMAKLDLALLAIDEKLYVGKMNEDYEKRIREYKKMLKKGE
jgi:tetratricopeptide (TPR) repeat protein